MRFIYVKSEQDRDRMLTLGYALLKEDKRNHIWVFQNKNGITFDSDGKLDNVGSKIVLSNTLTF